MRCLLIILILASPLTACAESPPDCVRDYLIAVNGNAMSWFVLRWDLGDRDFEAKSSMDLYRTVAGDVLAGRVYDLRPWDTETFIVRGARIDIERRLAVPLGPKIEVSRAFKYVSTSRDGWCEFKWDISSGSQGLVRSMLKEFGDKNVKPGKKRNP